MASYRSTWESHDLFKVLSHLLCPLQRKSLFYASMSLMPFLYVLISLNEGKEDSGSESHDSIQLKFNNAVLLLLYFLLIVTFYL